LLYALNVLQHVKNSSTEIKNNQLKKIENPGKKKAGKQSTVGEEDWQKNADGDRRRKKKLVFPNSDRATVVLIGCSRCHYDFFNKIVRKSSSGKNQVYEH